MPKVSFEGRIEWPVYNIETKKEMMTNTFTKDKDENTQKLAKKGPQRAKNQNFEKQKIAFFF